MMSISPKLLLRRAAQMGAVAALLVAPAAQADLTGFPLGQSARSNAVCEAQRVDDDPGGQVPHARSWTIACRGYEGIVPGHLYVFPGDFDGDLAAAAPRAWRDALSDRMTCDAFSGAQVANLSGVEHAACTPKHGKLKYSVYLVKTANGLAVAEGFEPIDELVQVGLQVVAGAASPPSSGVQKQTASAFSGPESGSLADAAAEAEQAPGWLRDHAHLENQGWRFADAERDFSLLAKDRTILPRDRAIIELNWALNVSNEGRFEDADGLFDLVNKDAASFTGDAELNMLLQNYRALHALNQKKFADAAVAATVTLNVKFAGADDAGAAAAPMPTMVDGGVYIGDDLAAVLNHQKRSLGFRSTELSPIQRRQILRAQAFYIVGCAQMGLGHRDVARTDLDDAMKQLGNSGGRSAGWLRAQIALQTARLDIEEHHPEQAEAGLTKMVELFQAQPNLAASPAEARLYLELARAESLDGKTDNALADYATGMNIFRQTRGTLGYSANEAAPYFDLLIARVKSDSANAARYQAQFFDAAQSVVSLATSRTVARLAARVGQSDANAQMLVRALDDARRQLTIKAAQVQRAQSAAGYTPEQRSADRDEIGRLSDEVESLQQQLLAANARFSQLVTTSATLDDMQKALSPGEVYVKTVLLASGGYGIAITRSTVDVYAIPLTKAQAADAVTKLRHPFDSTEFVSRFNVGASHELFTAVFGPVADKVVGAKTLIYEPDGPLLGLPASVFVTDTKSVDDFTSRVAAFKTNRNVDLYQGLSWLGRNTDVSLSVSAASFLYSRKFPASTASHVFAGLGAPTSVRDMRDPRLFALVSKGREGTSGAAACDQVRLAMAQALSRPIPGIDDTIRSIGRTLGAQPGDLVLGQAFTDTAMAQRTNLNDYQVVFFGTHGLLPSNEDCLPEPALVTSLAAGSPDSDGFLDSTEILQLHLDAELVVLSACSTGGVGSANGERTGLSDSGEALGGLARDFIYAGSRSLIVSQWEVDTKATLQLMKHLFQPGATTQGDALRQAQLALMDDKNFSHPYYWAGFSLVGDGARTMPAKKAR